MMFVLLKILASKRNKLAIVLQDEQTNAEGYISSNDLQYLLGKEGVALTDLRPSGRADFEGISLDVLADASYIVKGTKIVIQKVQGSKLVVKEKK